MRILDQFRLVSAFAERKTIDFLWARFKAITIQHSFVSFSSPAFIFIPHIQLSDY